ncbi:hypothetical protein AALP_AA3G106500 [Arabis alpina]|uniref:HhH-GPD domain-containing protein n=1 Tax=Arabis alpina TaxID=50452 RepID=A0A087H8D1_ARAAL|nr:hypothetical protein AALP_AA3G106500 [Arabis alpina]
MASCDLEDMEGEVKEDREREVRVHQVIPERHFVPGLPQEQSTFQYMQYNNHQLDSDRRRLTCTQLLALANTAGSSSSVGAASFPGYGADSQIPMDSWVNSWNMESNPCSLIPGAFLGPDTGSVTETTLERTQCDVPNSQNFICDLNLSPYEAVSTKTRPTEPEFAPVTLDTPGKTMPETDQKPPKPMDKSSPRTASPGAEKKRKRGIEEEKAAQIKTPQQIPKRKKIRGKVVREGNASTSKPAVEKASASAAKSSQGKRNVRPRRSTRRSLNFDEDSQEEEDGYCGLTFTAEGHIGVSVGGKIIPDATMGFFSNIPKKRRQRKSSSTEETVEEDSAGRNMITNAQTVSLSMSQNMLWLQFPNVQRKRRTGYTSVPQNDHKKVARKRSCIVTRPREIGSLKRIIEGFGPVKRDRKVTKRGPPQLQQLVSKMQSGITRKKRRKRDAVASKTKVILKWRRQKSRKRLPIDAIIKLFEELNINRESSSLTQSKETALILLQKSFEDQKAMVPYATPKTYQSKIQLDAETNRMWKLLAVSTESEGVDGSDEENQKWWQEERNVFKQLVKSFTSRMSRVQGDRSFSPWKGSVVDSVVGVFLTQNVADHSSSSAFMDVAAAFPVTSNSIKGSHEEFGSSLSDETIVNLDPGNAVATPGTCNPTSIIIVEIKDDDDDDIEAVSSQESSKTSDSSVSSTNQPKTLLLDPLANRFETHFEEGSSTVSSTSTSTSTCELNLNEAPLEVDEGSLVQPISNHQEDLKSTLQEQDQEQEKKTRTDSDVKKGKNAKKKELEKTTPKKSFDWDVLRKQAKVGTGKERERTDWTTDTVDYEALRRTSVEEIADIIRKRGMNKMLADRIKGFLNRLVQDHEEIDLEWLRYVEPDKAKEFLLSIFGLGLKSVECVRLLSLHQVAFPVDTNVGRIAVRLGWVPLQPLPDELQMHLLELYPVLESVQKYLWPRLCKLDQKTLYELHYHMITCGKVFCTKAKPNCKACPMKADCRHYASASASARLALQESEEDSNSVTIHEYKSKNVEVKFSQNFFLSQEEEEAKRAKDCEPTVDEPASPEAHYAEQDIEDIGNNYDPWEYTDIPTFKLNKEVEISEALVVQSGQASSIPRSKLKSEEKLRTEHIVYVLRDDSSLLEGFEKRDPDDKVPYLLAIWTPGETANSTQPPKQKCVFYERNTLCDERTCFPCNNTREMKSQTVRGTILIPSRTAMRGRFPLNGTYFQTNEVFADHATSIRPINVPRQWIWNLDKRIVYFGSSVSAGFGGLEVEAIMYGFWIGYVCVRAFDRRTRRPKPLMRRLHCAPSNKNQDEY